MNRNQIFLSLGSNLNRRQNLSSCLNYFSASFRSIQISPIYQTPAYGFDGNDFYNLVVGLESAFALQNLKNWLIKIEDLHGRDRNQPRYSNRTLDIDILLYNDLICSNSKVTLPREEILTRNYVLKPLSDLIPDKTHPITGRSYLQHWTMMKNTSQDEIFCINSSFFNQS